MCRGCKSSFWISCNVPAACNTVGQPGGMGVMALSWASFQIGWASVRLRVLLPSYGVRGALQAREFAGTGPNKIPIPGKKSIPGRNGGTKRVKGQKGQGKKKGLFG